MSTSGPCSRREPSRILPHVVLSTSFGYSEVLVFRLSRLELDEVVLSVCWFTCERGYFWRHAVAPLLACIVSLSCFPMAACYVLNPELFGILLSLTNVGPYNFC